MPRPASQSSVTVRGDTLLTRAPWTTPIKRASSGTVFLQTPRAVEHWSLTTLRKKLIEIGRRRWFITPDTSRSNWRRWPCRARSVRSSWNGCGGSRRSLAGPDRHEGTVCSPTGSTKRGVGSRCAEIRWSPFVRPASALRSRASWPVSTHHPSAGGQIGLPRRERGGNIMMENVPATSPGEGQMENVGWLY